MYPVAPVTSTRIVVATIGVSRGYSAAAFRWDRTLPMR